MVLQVHFLQEWFCLMLGAINKDNVILRSSKKDGQVLEQ